MIKCIAIDDEPIALSIIRDHVKHLGDDVELQCFTSPVEGMVQVAETRPDILFLDVEMGTHNGIALARTLPEDTCLVFTTAYSRYAVDAFNVDAVDFLHKPIFFERFKRAFDKAVARRREVGEGGVSRESIMLKVEYRNTVVYLDDIVYVESMDNYVKVYRRNKPMLLSQITMKELEGMLPAEKFVRVHRSYMVGVRSVEMFSGRGVYMSGVPTPIPVGRTYASALNRLADKLGG